MSLQEISDALITWTPSELRGLAEIIRLATSLQGTEEYADRTMDECVLEAASRIKQDREAVDLMCSEYLSADDIDNVSDN
jgi:hypothetical protein